MENKYVLRWWHSDGSGNGVHDQIFTEAEREKLIELIPVLYPSVNWEFVQVFE